MIVYTLGTFDLLHVGHLALLEYCKSLGDTLAVGAVSYTHLTLPTSDLV